VTQQSIANPSLELKLYGGASKEIQLTGALNNENNPIHVWTGLCTSGCAVAFRDKGNMVDLSGLARIRWNTKMSGFHQVRPIVKLADGTWLIGDRADGTTRDEELDRLLALGARRVDVGQPLGHLVQALRRRDGPLGALERGVSA